LLVSDKMTTFVPEKKMYFFVCLFPTPISLIRICDTFVTLLLFLSQLIILFL